VLIVTGAVVLGVVPGEVGFLDLARDVAETIGEVSV